MFIPAHSIIDVSSKYICCWQIWYNSTIEIDIES